MAPSLKSVCISCHLHPRLEWRYFILFLVCVCLCMCVYIHVHVYVQLTFTMATAFEQLIGVYFMGRAFKIYKIDEMALKFNQLLK